MTLLQESDFYLYALYNKNKPKSDELMTECGSEYFRVSAVSHLFVHLYFMLEKNTHFFVFLLHDRHFYTFSKKNLFV